MLARGRQNFRGFNFFGFNFREWLLTCEKRENKSLAKITNCTAYLYNNLGVKVKERRWCLLERSVFAGTYGTISVSKNKFVVKHKN